MELPEEVLSNLRASGLSDKSIEQMRVRVALPQDLPMSFPGYVIPYFVPIEGGKYLPMRAGDAPYNRVRIMPVLAKGGGIEREMPQKYYQRSGTGSHLYFPPLVPAEDWFDITKPLIITEGEKKAAAACQTGFLTVAVGGIDSWRSRKIRVPPESVSAGGKSVIVEMSDEVDVKMEMKACDEFTWLPLEGREVYICYDTDPSRETLARVQRAAFDLGLWLEQQGAYPKNIELPLVRDAGEDVVKGALDDYLLVNTPADFMELMERATFPTRPRMKSWVRKQLSNPRRNRNTMTSVSRGVLAALDAGGTRYRDPTGTFFYFDKHTDVLHTLPIENGQPLQVSAPSFHRMLVTKYGLSSADREVVTRLVDDAQSLPKVEEVDKVYQQSHAARDAFYYQISDSEMVRVNAEGIRVMRNGTDGVLFESGAENVELYRQPIPKDFGWLKTLQTTSLQAMPGMTMDETYAIVAGLFYLSPWMRRWRGLMLPLELAISEAGSGKSSLYQLRKAIFAGGSGQLQHQPDDMKSWYSSIAAARGMWVADNVGAKVDVRISNELARLITDPEPAFELRELYTTSKVHRKPVDCTFAVTAIYNPFNKPDILQRSIQLTFKARGKGQRDGDWLREQIEDGARERWLMHHFRMIAKFLREAGDIRWGKSSSHRLVGFEQSLLVMGRVMGIPSLMEQAVSKLDVAVRESIAEQEPVIEALRVFVDRKRMMYNGRGVPERAVFSLDEIYEWVQGDMTNNFRDIRLLSSPRLLERHILAHAADIRESTGIQATGEVSQGIRVFEIDFTKAMASASSRR